MQEKVDNILQCCSPQRRPELKALRIARADAGLTISEVAERAGVSRDTVSKLEKGQHSPQASTLNKIARALGKAPSELLAEEESYPKAQAPPPLENGPAGPGKASDGERRLLRAWRAFVYKLVHRWETKPPTSRHEVAVVLEAMQALMAEGAFERPPEEITTGSWDTAGEWMEKQFLFRGIERLNRIADDIEAEEEAERRRATFREIKDRMAETA